LFLQNRFLAAKRKRVENVLTQTGFDKFLAALDADREQAGAKYESLRARLVKFFEWRNCDTPDELTDVVFDRITKKIAAGEQIQNINAYSVTVAQFVFKEDCRSRERLFQSIDDNPQVENSIASDASDENDETGNARLDCLDECLAEFSGDNRRLITAYYDTDDQTMIATRRRLADSAGVSLNTLRIRVCRLKAKLEDCTKDCCRKVQS
jgi:DNA-directed RNA polymerase specialized sigma24 family protein